MQHIKKNIVDYIKSNSALCDLDFFAVYVTIIELIKDGKMEFPNGV